MIANSIMTAGGPFAAGKTITYGAARSVLKTAGGDKLSLTSDGLGRLATAFLAEIERRYLNA
jgi:2-keto-4-pentenoate hydratase